MYIFLGKLTGIHFPEENKNETELSKNYEHVKKECAIYQERVKALEADLIKCIVENTKLETQSKALAESCSQLEAALGSRDGDYWKSHAVVSKSELEETAKKLADAHEEIVLVKERYEECNKEKSYLQGELNSLKEQLQLLSVQSKTVSLFFNNVLYKLVMTL
ncbi:uncharacterized protein LOC118195237 isoform X2 [Stegodyphus dumicola]|uniref:uncharacterized protein LOC118195237 isoform X2 n=1 Tax=Stegodyphus dumicola TaxID=202533 RepID=UPI0015B322FB|nr:uncharacterized protein LOC118195237 isoform X2 [Stegodyphus dumicola]